MLTIAVLDNYASSLLFLHIYSFHATTNILVLLHQQAFLFINMLLKLLASTGISFSFINR